MISAAGTPDTPALRRCVLAVSVLADIDIEPTDNGVVLPGPPRVRVSWRDVAEVVARHAPDSPVARRRVEELLRLRLVLTGREGSRHPTLRDRARLVALPPDHAHHPGPGWVREHLLGGALELGVGLLGLVGDPDSVLPLPPVVAAAAKLDVQRWWPGIRVHADRMGRLAAARLRRLDEREQERDRDPDEAGRASDGDNGHVIRPVGGCDVLALLSSPTLRRQLIGMDPARMCALAVPMRRRGWFDTAQIDPAFVLGAWAATDDFDRGLPRPVLVTLDEVSLVATGGGRAPGIPSQRG